MKAKDFPQLALMREGVNYSEEITLRNYNVRVRPLTNLEIISCVSRAAEEIQKLPEFDRNSIRSSLLLASFQLERASAPDVDEFPTLTMKIIEHMSPDEINHLWKQYVRMTDKVNPSFDDLTEETLDLLVSDLKKNSEPLSMLTDLSISKLIAVCHHLLKT